MNSHSMRILCVVAVLFAGQPLPALATPGCAHRRGSHYTDVCSRADLLRLDGWAVRQSDWKLIGKGRDEPVFLGNLAKDVSEKESWHEAHPDVVERLKRLHVGWAASIR